MKHLWFGTGLLAALLVVSLWLGSSLENTQHIPASDLEKAAQAALDEQWGLATTLSRRSETDWQRRRNLTAALSHHDLLDRIDEGFVMLEDFARCKDAAAFAATCSRLAQQLRSLPQSHSLSLWNLL